jgi:uncharacterized protein YkwD
MGLVVTLLALAVCQTPTLGDSGPPPPGTDVRAQAERIVALTNEIRVQRGLKPLAPLGYLDSAALGHSSEMLELKYFSHTSPIPGRTKTKDRIVQAGGTWRACAENIYRSTGVPLSQAAQRTVDALQRSPSHFKNMISPNYTHIGVGIATSGSEVVVTQVFAKP